MGFDVIRKNFEKIFYSRQFIIVFSSLYYFIFILVFKPFGWSALELENSILYIAGYAVICALVLILNSIIYSRLKLIRINWIIKNSVFILVCIFEIALLSWRYTLIFIPLQFGVNRFTNHLMIIFIVSALPIFLVILFEEWIMLNKQLPAYKETETQPGSEKPDELIKLTSFNKNEEVELYVQQLLCMQSNQNYVTIYYAAGDKIKKVFMRSTLKNIEEQLLPFDIFIRCHRFYIVNKTKIEKIFRTSNNLRLKIQGLDFKISVSRNIKKEQLTYENTPHIMDYDHNQES